MRLRNVVFVMIGWMIVTSVHGSEGPWVESIESPQYFAVSVEDIEQAVAWYQSAFGLEVLDGSSDDQGAWRIVNLHRDGLSVELIYDSRDAPKSGRTQGVAKVGFRVSDVRKVADRVEKATGERPRVLDFSAHGIRLIQLRDPEDNVIQLTSPLAETSAVGSLTSPADRGRELMALANHALGGEAHQRVRSLRVVADCTHGAKNFSTEPS